MPLVRVCAWCGHLMGEKPGEGSTHGICPSCLDEAPRESQEPLRTARGIINRLALSTAVWALLVALLLFLLAGSTT